MFENMPIIISEPQESLFGGFSYWTWRFIVNGRSYGDVVLSSPNTTKEHILKIAMKWHERYSGRYWWLWHYLGKTIYRLQIMKTKLLAKGVPDGD